MTYFTPELEAFLKEKGAYGRAIVAIEEQGYRRTSMPYRNLHEAFVWADSEEKNEYWRLLNNAFESTIDGGGLIINPQSN